MLQRPSPQVDNATSVAGTESASAHGRRWLTIPTLCGRLLHDQRRLPLAVLLLGLTLTAAVTEYTRHQGQQSHERLEQGLLDDVADAIEVKLKEDIDTINGVAGLFNASTTVSRQEFTKYYQTLRRDDDSLAGIQGIGFSRFVPAADWQRLIASVRAEGFADFSIRPAGPRLLGSSIVFLEPFDLRNQRAFGFDMYSEATRRQAMDRAAQTGMPSMSGRVRLLQERNTGVQPGVLIYAPIYRKGTLTPPRDPSQYVESLVGWAYSPIRVGDLVSAALRTVNNPDLPGSAVLVHDGASSTGSSVIFDNLRLSGHRALTDPQYQPIEIAGRTWLIGIQLNRQQIGPHGWSMQVLIVAVLGTMGSTIAALITALLVNNHWMTRQALETAEKANQERALASTVFEASPQAMVVTDPLGRVISANQAFSRITGYASAEVLGHSLSLLKSGRHEKEFYTRLWNDVNERGFWQGEIWNRLRDGEIRRHELSITAVRDRELCITHYVGMLQDITERHQVQEQIRHRALHDDLTGLPSRALLLERLNAALALAERQSSCVGLLFLDLNGFKPVNDEHGHAAGDRVLRLVAKRLRGGLYSEDLVARMGGDEFVVLVPRAGDLDELRACALRLQGLIRSCGEEFDQPINISASIGVARAPEHGVTAGKLLAAADQAMYRAKQGECDGIVIAQRTDWSENERMATDLSFSRSLHSA